jgi:hypothetical protein
MSILKKIIGLAIVILVGGGYIRNIIDIFTATNQHEFVIHIIGFVFPPLGIIAGWWY